MPVMKKRPAIKVNNKTVSVQTVTKTTPEAEPLPLRASKQESIIALLKREQGATIAELTAATGWQKHSIRGVISGALKKRMSLTIVSAIEPHGRVYRITGE